MHYRGNRGCLSQEEINTITIQFTETGLRNYKKHLNEMKNRCNAVRVYLSKAKHDKQVEEQQNSVKVLTEDINKLFTEWTLITGKKKAELDVYKNHQLLIRGFVIPKDAEATPDYRKSIKENKLKYLQALLPTLTEIVADAVIPPIRLRRPTN